MSRSHRSAPIRNRLKLPIRKQRSFCYHRLIGVNRTATTLILHAALRAVSLALLGAVSLAQSTSGESRLAPAELVRKAVHNEIQASGAHFMFRDVKTTPKGTTTRIYVETREGTAALTVASDGKPLTSEQRAAEQARLERFLKNPDDLRKKHAQEREDAERTTRIMRALPDAFLYEYAGKETGSAGIGRPGDPLVKLSFRPNPAYRPPSRVEEVLTGMQGHLLIDEARFRLASIDGTLFRDVGFGWGILGRLNKGGHFVVHQLEVEDDFWEISKMTVSFTGKILLVKNLSIQSSEAFSGFKRVPSDLTFAQAIELLKKEEAASAGTVSKATSP